MGNVLTNGTHVVVIRGEFSGERGKTVRSSKKYEGYIDVLLWDYGTGIVVPIPAVNLVAKDKKLRKGFIVSFPENDLDSFYSWGD